MRTAGVKKLMGTVLDTLPKPHGEDVIDEVFFEIEYGPEYRLEYDALCRELGKTVVNTWGGYWIAHALGMSGPAQVPAKKSKLIQSYSRLTAPAVAPGGKRKEPAALELMSSYYQEHKGTLPASVRNHRELIVELIMSGILPEHAFAMVPADFTPPPAPASRRR